MGLDMYLRAEKRFGPNDPTTDQILSAAGTTLADLQARSVADPYEMEQSLYIAGYDFRAEEKVVYDEITMIVRGGDLITSESPSIFLGYDDGNLVVQLTCAYWRKANSVHSWFVENCQGGIDECQETPIHVEQLAHLRSTCVEALDAYEDGEIARAEQIMTPESGFFFGGTEVDEWWARDMQETIDQIDRCINAAIKVGGISFVYQSSW